MTAPRCARCGSTQPIGPAAGPACVYCGAWLTDAAHPPVGRIRWRAVAPPGSPAARRRVRRRNGPYTGPPTYGTEHPAWGFPPSVWRPVAEPEFVAPAVRDAATGLRTVAVFARATAVALVLAAGFEGWRYVLMVRGRTEVLPATAVLVDDASVAAAGWVALLLGVITVISLLPVLARTATVAAARAGTTPSRTPGQRLSRLLIPGWNLYGAGAVLAELDALLQVGPVAAPTAAKPDTLRWLSAELPGVSANLADRTTAEPKPDQPGGQIPAVEPAPEPPVHRRPGRLVGWWWAAWIVNGLLVASELLRMIWQDTLQARADLVAIHLAVAVSGAVVAALTASLLSRFSRLLQPLEQTWNPAWQVVPPATGAAFRGAQRSLGH